MWEYRYQVAKGKRWQKRLYPISDELLARTIVEAAATGQVGNVDIASWRWNNRFQRFTFISTTGITHIIQRKENK